MEDITQARYVQMMSTWSSGAHAPLKPRAQVKTDALKQTLAKETKCSITHLFIGCSWTSEKRNFGYVRHRIQAASLRMLLLVIITKDIMLPIVEHWPRSTPVINSHDWGWIDMMKNIHCTTNIRTTSDSLFWTCELLHSKILSTDKFQLNFCYGRVSVKFSN